MTECIVIVLPVIRKEAYDDEFVTTARPALFRPATIIDFAKVRAARRSSEDMHVERTTD